MTIEILQVNVLTVKRACINFFFSNVAFMTLQETGIAKIVRAFRDREGEIGAKAKELFTLWRSMFKSKSNSSTEPSSPGEARPCWKKHLSSLYVMPLVLIVYVETAFDGRRIKRERDAEFPSSSVTSETEASAHRAIKRERDSERHKINGDHRSSHQRHHQSNVKRERVSGDESDRSRSPSPTTYRPIKRERRLSSADEHVINFDTNSSRRYQNSLKHSASESEYVPQKYIKEEQHSSADEYKPQASSSSAHYEPTRIKTHRDTSPPPSNNNNVRVKRERSASPDSSDSEHEDARRRHHKRPDKSRKVSKERESSSKHHNKDKHRSRDRDGDRTDKDKHRSHNHNHKSSARSESAEKLSKRSEKSSKSRERSSKRDKKNRSPDDRDREKDKKSKSREKVRDKGSSKERSVKEKKDDVKDRKEKKLERPKPSAMVGFDLCAAIDLEAGQVPRKKKKVRADDTSAAPSSDRSASKQKHKPQTSEAEKSSKHDKSKHVTSAKRSRDKTKSRHAVSESDSEVETKKQRQRRRSDSSPDSSDDAVPKPREQVPLQFLLVSSINVLSAHRCFSRSSQSRPVTF